MVSNDYFFQLCDTRAQLASCEVVLGNLVESFEESNLDLSIRSEVSLKLAKEQLVVITSLLKKGI